MPVLSASLKLTVFEMSTAMAAQQARIASLESQMAQLGTQNSPIAIGVQTSK